MFARLCVICAALLLAVSLAGPAAASQLLARNATKIKLVLVLPSNKAMITYTVAGKLRHTLVWGPVDARAPDQNLPQVKLNVDYTGGFAALHKRKLWKRKNRCRPYDGPQLPYLVAACKAADGSYWALQQWQVAIPLLGFAPFLPRQSDFFLHISHWRAPLAQFELWTDWINTAAGPPASHNITGRLTYGGAPVYGFRTNNVGAPLDGYGRVVFIETLDSAYGPGWMRETGIVTLKPSGLFCHAFVPQTPAPGYPSRDLRPAADGTRYRVTVIGPGVTPDVVAEIEDPGDYDPADPAKVERERAANAVLDQAGANPTFCPRF